MTDKMLWKASKEEKSGRRGEAERVRSAGSGMREKEKSEERRKKRQEKGKERVRELREGEREEGLDCCNDASEGKTVLRGTLIFSTLDPVC